MEARSAVLQNGRFLEMELQRIADYLSSLECDADELLEEMRTYAELHDVPIVRPETESFLRTMVAAKRPERILEIGTAIGYSTIVMARAQAGAGITGPELMERGGDGTEGQCAAKKAAAGKAVQLPCLVTIESWERRIPIAQENLRRAGLSGTVQLIHGDAGTVLKALCGEQNLARCSDTEQDTVQELNTAQRFNQEQETAERFYQEQDAAQQFDLVFLDAAKGQYLNWLPDILRLMRDGALLIADNVLQDHTVMEPRCTVERRERTTHSRMREFLYEIKHCPELVSAVIPLGDGVSISVRQRNKDGSRSAWKQNTGK